jgi:hypothetical protein
LTGRRRGGKVWKMDGEGVEGWELNIPAEYGIYLREDEIASRVDKAVRERRVWLAAAAELRETEEVKRTGPASPAPCLQGRRKGEDVELCLPGTTREDREHREHREFSEVERTGPASPYRSGLWGAYRSYGVRFGTPKTVRRARRQGASTECWLCGLRGCDCEASEDSCSAPVTPEQRTISMEQVTPERTGGAEGEFSLGPAAVEERGERTREVGTQMQTAEGPTADRERTGMTDADEIQELKVCVEELQAQVLGAGRLAAMVADWTVASPGATVREIQRKDTQCRGAGRLKAQRARDKADRLTAIARKATADANAAEAAAEMRDRAAEMAAVRREEHVQKRAGRTKKATATTTTMDRTTATTGTMDTPVEERRAAMKGISTQSTQYSEEQNSTVTAIEMEKYRTKNRPWD